MFVEHQSINWPPDNKEDPCSRMRIKTEKLLDSSATIGKTALKVIKTIQKNFLCREVKAIGLTKYLHIQCWSQNELSSSNKKTMYEI